MNNSRQHFYCRSLVRAYAYGFRLYTFLNNFGWIPTKLLINLNLIEELQL